MAIKDRYELYNDIQKDFYDLSKLDIQRGSAIDNYIMASSTAAEAAYLEIKNSKNPHLYTGLSGNDIDSFGLLINCPRLPGENDDTYLHRCINWTGSNEASNIIAIENALINIDYVSNATYIPMTNGTGTGSVYIIPKTYDSATIANALTATQQRLRNVVSPGSRINYIIPKVRSVVVTIYLSTSGGDINDIKKNLNKKIGNYINGIAVGDYLEIGDINKIGVEEPNVDYFNVTQLAIDGVTITDLKIIQKIDSKFIFDTTGNSTIWWMAVR
jgi:hypothetical protein